MDGTELNCTERNENSIFFPWNKKTTEINHGIHTTTTNNNTNEPTWIVTMTMWWWQTLSARHSRTNEKSSVMWLNTIVGRAGGGAASKALSTVRYSTIGLHERSASGQIILPLDVEETVTCFCRFEFCALHILLCFLCIMNYHFPFFHSSILFQIDFTPLFIQFSRFFVLWFGLLKRRRT